MEVVMLDVQDLAKRLVDVVRGQCEVLLPDRAVHLTVLSWLSGRKCTGSKANK